MKAEFAGLVLAAALGAAPAGPLVRFVGQARVLVISAPNAADPNLERQDHNLASFSAEMNDRDLVVVHAVGDQATDTRGERLDPAAVRRAAGLASDRFGVALVGKDGGVKLRRDAPIAVKALFQTIDAMPMRQDEMRRNGR